MTARLRLSAWLAIGMALAVPLPAATSPAGARDDHVPAKVHQRSRIAFPARPLAEGIRRGKAVVMLEVDAFGELRDVLVVAYTQRDFADAVLAAVKEWRFTPGSIGGEPAGSNVRIVADFQVNGVHAYAKPVGPDREEPSNVEGFVYHPWSVAALDRVPAALARPGPIYPREWIQAGRVGTVIVEFFIDEGGRARFPEVVGEADDLLGVAATVAVKDWQFESPLRGGRPVLVRVQQVFNFRPPLKTEKTTPPATPRSG